MNEIIREQFMIQVDHDGLIGFLPKSYDTVDEAIEAMKDKQTRNPADMRVVRILEEVVATANRRTRKIDEGTDDEVS